MDKWKVFFLVSKAEFTVNAFNSNSKLRKKKAVVIRRKCGEIFPEILATSRRAKAETVVVAYVQICMYLCAILITSPVAKNTCCSATLLLSSHPLSLPLAHTHSHAESTHAHQIQPDIDGTSGECKSHTHTTQASHCCHFPLFSHFVSLSICSVSFIGVLCSGLIRTALILSFA